MTLGEILKTSMFVYIIVDIIHKPFDLKTFDVVLLLILEYSYKRLIADCWSV